MIDLLIMMLLAATFYAGYKAGNKWKSLAEMADAAIRRFK